MYISQLSEMIYEQGRTDAYEEVFQILMEAGMAPRDLQMLFGSMFYNFAKEWGIKC